MPPKVTQLRCLQRIGARQPYSVAAISRKSRQAQVQETTQPLDVTVFRRDAFEPAQPLVMRAAEGAAPLFPARKWLVSAAGNAVSDCCGAALFREGLGKESVSHMVAYELSLEPPLEGPMQGFLAFLDSSNDPIRRISVAILRAHTKDYFDTRPGDTQFKRFDAPLDLMMAALEFNSVHVPDLRLTQLYIAQVAVSSLPQPLQADLPTPELVAHGGKGDVYQSSIWLGLERTYTPWHRDPNPNLFHQLWNKKDIRLLPPRRGQLLFDSAMAQIGPGDSASRIRGSEMMEGEEKKALFDAVWGESAQDDILRVSVGPGDGLFIPKGWWHSLSSNGWSGEPNFSVNWWFR